MGWIAQPLGTWTVFSAEGELCAGESVAAWEVGIPGMQRFNGRCSKGATVVCTNVEKRETSRLWSASAFAATQCSGEHDAHSHARTMQEGVVSLPQRVSSNPRPRRPRPHIQDPPTHLLLLVYSCCYLPNTLHIIRIASLLRQRCALLLHPLFQNPCCFNLRFPLSTLRGVETAAKLKQTTLLLWTGRSLLEHASSFCLSCLFPRYPYLPA